MKTVNLFDMFFIKKNKFLLKYTFLLLILIAFSDAASAQSYVLDMRRDSARSDKLTGGSIEKTVFRAGESNIKLTINIPSFQMTLWQNGKEVKTYPIGVGMKDYPLFVGLRQASDVIWNPAWIPPSSDWIEASSKVKPGEVVLPTDPRNPLGKMKIPLGYGYLIHQAKGVQDLGSLVSHGCVRVLQSDLYDLAEKIVAARSLPLSAQEIAAVKKNKKTLVAELTPPVPVEITYDTLVVEAGKLNVYPDVYEHKFNTPDRLLAELKSSGVDASDLTDADLKKILSRAVGKTKFTVSVRSIEAGNALRAGQISAVVAQAVAASPGRNKRAKR